MATGRLAAKDLSQSVTTSIYTCPTNLYSTITIAFCNRTPTSARLTLHIESSATTAPSNAALIEKSMLISGYTSLEKVGIVMGPGNIIYAMADKTAAVSCMVWGFEESL
jgi:hypothetical protein